MQVVIVSSPGRGPAAHWSQAMAAALAARWSAADTAVSWLAVVPAGMPPPMAPANVAQQVFVMPPSTSLSRVAAASRHLPVELALTHLLRESAARTVVHVGIGARGSPNVNWLADRLGAVPFAVARAGEVVCHRGDLVDRDARPCHDFLDAERCRRCCHDSWWRRAHADDFRSRGDLLVASLLASVAVFVPDDDDVRRLVDFGLPARALTIATAADEIAARIGA